MFPMVYYYTVEANIHMKCSALAVGSKEPGLGLVNLANVICLFVTKLMLRPDIKLTSG